MHKIRSIRFAVARSIVILMYLMPVRTSAQSTSSIEVNIGRIADSLFAKDFAAHRFTSAAFVFVRDTSVGYAKGYGEADAIRHTKVDPSRTVYRIASISKLFAATAVMQLAEEGKLDLHADINLYLKTFQLEKRYGQPVTAASLLTHTSGLENRALGSIARNSGDLVPLGSYFSTHPPHVDAEPGSQFSYSNNGIGLAGYLVEAVSGERFDDYVEKHILKPLGMTSASFRQPVPEDLVSRMAGGKRTQRAPLFNPYPAGALMATPMDMSRFIIAQLNGGTVGGQRMLGAPMLDEMQRTQWTAHAGAPGAAYGFFEGTMRGHRILFHTGDSGHHGIIVIVPELRIGLYAVYDTQDDGSHEMMETLTRAIVNQYPAGAVDSLIPPPRSDVRGHVQRYAGVYGANGADPHTIEKAAGLMQQVIVSDNGDGKLRLTPSAFDAITATEIEPDLFRGSDGSWVAFSRNVKSEGPAEGMTVTGGISDPFAVHRIPWYADARLHRVVLGAGLAAILSRIIVAVVGLIRRKRPASKSGLASLGWRLSGLLSICVLLIPPSLFAGFAMNRPPIVALPGGVKVALGLLLIASIVALSMPV
ncbi:MAG: serine hydrolase domain-containing protein, partial [Gemmatimonadales bacterium]